MTGLPASVLLLSMPWETLEFPSIQLGLLQAALEQDAVATDVRSLKLDWLEYCIRATAHNPPDQRLGVAEYDLVIELSREVNLGDWIFSVPPFRTPTQESDLDYLALFRGRPDAATEAAIAQRFRTLVPGFLERCVAEIMATSPRVIGLTTGANQAVPSLVLARLLKDADPTIQIVLGGANCQGAMGAALHRSFPWIDVVARGEGELVLPALVRQLLTGQTPEPAPGLCFRDSQRQVVVEEGAGTIPMDMIPTPRYDEFFARLASTTFRSEIEGRLGMFYESARGCWWGAKSHCVFCGISDLVMPFRSKSPGRVLAELSGLSQRYGLGNFLVVDYILDWRYFRDVLPQLAEQKQDFHLFCETKANLKKEQVALLRSAGFVAVQAGIESLSNPILGLMRKGVTAFQNIRLIKWCAELDVRLHWNVIYGLPGEPPEEYARMADVMRSMVHLAPPQIVPLAVDRFSPHHEDPASFGLELLGPRRDYRLIYPPLPEQALMDLAYTFEYRHADGREPASYAEPLIRVVTEWQRNREESAGTLRWQRDVNEVVIIDRRPGLESHEFRLEGAEGAIYLACNDGAMFDEITAAAQLVDPDLETEDVRSFLAELVAARLVYREGEKYLGLALTAPEDAEPRSMEEEALTTEDHAVVT